MTNPSDDLLVWENTSTPTPMVPKPLEEVTKLTKALPAYFGGKRKILKHIFSDRIPSSGTIVDPMAGSMTIPLVAKHLGYRAIANDRSTGSYIIGKALVENNSHRIDISNLSNLILTDTTKNDHFVTQQFGDFHLPRQLAVYADNLHSHILNMDDEQWVYKLLLYRFLTFMAPYNLYRYPGLVKGFLSNTYPASMTKHIEKWNTNIDDPLPTFIKMAKQINDAVGEGCGEVHQKEVFEFMEHHSSGDVFYFDPPYAGAGVPYEKGYAVIEQMMERTLVQREVSDFNNLEIERDVLKRSLEFGASCSHILFSYWTEVHERDWFADLFREVGLDFEEIPLGDYSYSYSTKVGKKGEWSSQKTKGTKEILYLCTPIS